MEHAQALEHHVSQNPQIHTLREGESPFLWQDIAFEWIQAPQQHNAFTKTSILKWKNSPEGKNRVSL